MSQGHSGHGLVYQPRCEVWINPALWSKNSVIYEINTRQFTREGTFTAVVYHLPRLRDLGVDILWLMPIYPIGLKNRKGSLGSPYAVQDYLKVDPELGTLTGLRNFVQYAHELGMYVIIDCVAKYSAWDNIMVVSHCEWYDRNYKDDLRPTPWWDWSDIKILITTRQNSGNKSRA